jgi:hypothetical protein
MLFNGLEINLNKTLHSLLAVKKIDLSSRAEMAHPLPRYGTTRQRRDILLTYLMASLAADGLVISFQVVVSFLSSLLMKYRHLRRLRRVRSSPVLVPLASFFQREVTAVDIGFDIVLFASILVEPSPSRASSRLLTICVFVMDGRSLDSDCFPICVKTGAMAPRHINHSSLYIFMSSTRLAIGPWT